MRINKGLAILELKIQGFTLNPTLLWDDEMAVLIDTGMPGQFEQIRLAMNDLGIPFEKLQAVILTHQDLDHIGSLPEILSETNNHVCVYAHNLDKPYIEGTLPLLKTDPNRLSKDEWAALPEQMKFLYKNPPKSKIKKTVKDGELLPFCGGVQVVFTPGHTPGHISLYLKQSKTLIAGDALVAKDGILRGPIPQTTLDMKIATDSLEKLLDFDIETVICYHGGVCKLKEKKQLEALLVK